MCVSGENVNFSKNSAYVINGWFPSLTMNKCLPTEKGIMVVKCYTLSEFKLSYDSHLAMISLAQRGFQRGKYFYELYSRYNYM